MSTDPLKEEKLRELVAKWRELATWEHEHSVRQRDEGLMDDENYVMCGARMTVLEECADELEQALAAQPEPGETRKAALDEVVFMLQGMQADAVNRVDRGNVIDRVRGLKRRAAGEKRA
jgi:hypothetical protein